MNQGALSDLLVIECAEGIPGPFCGKLLADYGAEVVKVEPPAGDRSRAHGPFPGGDPHPDKSGQFLYLNANKRGVQLDIETPAGRDALSVLLRKADVLIIDLPPARLARARLTYDHLRADYPRLIVVALTPFGLTGPYKDYVATDLTLFHMGGMGRETPYNELTDLESFPPLWAGGYQAQYITGMTAATSVMAAVWHRAAYGEGQLVDLGGLECVANMLRASVPFYTFNPAVNTPTRLKKGFAWVMPCKDGHISIALNSDHWWNGFCAIMAELGAPDWLENDLFATAESRTANIDALEQLITEWTMQHSQQEIYEKTLARAIPCFPVNSMEQVVDSRQFRYREFIQVVEHPVAGPVRQPGPPVRMSATPWSIRRPAPLLGQHNDDVQREFGGPPATPSAGSAPVGPPR